MVGGINPYRKNHRLLIDAVDKLLSTGEKSFKITVVGRGNKANIPQNMQAYFELTGYLDFPSMAQKMQEADFFLPLLDPENKAHERYITTGVTGSAQLIYGFLKPPLISRKFTAFYRFDDENAIVYDGNDLATAMLDAMRMDVKQYKRLCARLSALSTRVQEESVDNLKMVVGLIKERKKR